MQLINLYAGADSGECPFAGISSKDIKGVADYQKYYEKRGNHLVTSKIEHHATLNTCRYLNGEIYSNHDATFSLDGRNPVVDRGFRVTFFLDTYWSGENDLINEFYIPCLSESVEYCRAVGYFSSSILCYITNGLFPFIQNGGSVRIPVW